MADTNSWGTVTFEIPEFLEGIRDAINSVAEWMVAVLDIALLALNFVKTFLVGYLDPILALVQALVDEINSLLRDLRQLGLYMTGDWPLLSGIDQLRGGFAEYERRMIARLTDRTDPTRPDVSGATTVLSLFFYVSTDLSEIERLIRTIKALVAYFEQEPKLTSFYPACQITEIVYGASASSVFNFGDYGAFFEKSTTPPALALVKWNMAAAFKGDTLLPPVSVPPGGFIVTVSTLPEGIRVVYDRPQGNQTKKKVLGKDEKAQPREYGAVYAEGKPFILHGGADMLADIPEEMTYNEGVEDGKVKDGATRVYGLAGSSRTPIPIDQMIPAPADLIPGSYDTTVGLGNHRYLQKTYFVSPSQVGAAFATGEYSLLIKGQEMPRKAYVETDSKGKITLVDDGPATILYVRVAACSKSVAQSGEFRFKFEPGTKSVTGQPIQVGVAKGTSEDGKSPSQIGEFSEPQQVIFSSAETTYQYMQALKTALLVLVLSRPDLQPMDLIEGTVSAKTLERMRANKLIVQGVAQERCGLEEMKHLTDVVYDQKTPYAKAVVQSDRAPAAFRKDLVKRIEMAAHDIYRKTGPMPEMESFIVAQTKYLREVTWGDILTAAYPEYAENWENHLSSGWFSSSLWYSLESGASDGVVRNVPSALQGNVSEAFTVMASPTIMLGREPHMQWGYVDDPSGKWAGKVGAVFTFASETDLQEFLDDCPAGLQEIYGQSITSEYDIEVPVDVQPQLEKYKSKKMLVGSADLSPVFAISDEGQPLNMIYLRGLFAKHDETSQNRIFQQSALALRIAGAAIRRSLVDGEWLYLRWFDTLPGLEDFLQQLANWAEAIRAALESIVDTIKKYIEYIEARIVELQQLIKRINSLLQSVLGFMFQIPQCSALALVSNGTGGVLADLVTAENKPSDSPLAYGGGIAVVVPLFPSFALLDLLLALWKTESKSPEGPMGQDPSTVQGIDGVPEPIPEPVEPDVL